MGDDPVRQAERIGGATQRFDIRLLACQHDLDRAEPRLETLDIAAERKDVALKFARKGADEIIGLGEICVIAGEEGETGEDARQHAIGRRGRIVIDRPCTDDKGGGVGGGEEVSAIRLVGIMGIKLRNEALRGVEVTGLECRFVKRQRRIGHEGEIACHGKMLQPSRAPGVMEATVADHGLFDEAEGACCPIDPARFAEGHSGAGEGCDHQAIPVRQHLVVETGMDAGDATGEEFPFQRFECSFLRLGDACIREAEAVEDIRAFPIAAGRHVIGLLETIGVGAQHLVDLGCAPDIEPAFLAVAIGVE